MAEQRDASRPVVVLIANDQEWSARSLDSILSPQGYAIIRAYTGMQALERARISRPDLVILDAQLPDIHGLEVCRQLRADPSFGRVTPIIITTAGPSGRTQRLAAYEAGAWEFYGQPLDGEALLTRFKTFVEAKLEADRLRDGQLIDADNGLYTLRGLAQRASEIGSEMARTGRPFACLAVALGGAQAGPVTLGDLLRTHRRAADAVAHLGGAEYLIAAPDTAGDGVIRWVERLRRLVETSGAPASQLAAGYSAVTDMRTAGLEAAAMLDHATAALRYSLGHPARSAITAFEDIPSQTATA